MSNPSELERAVQERIQSALQKGESHLVTVARIADALPTADAETEAQIDELLKGSGQGKPIGASLKFYRERVKQLEFTLEVQQQAMNLFEENSRGAADLFEANLKLKDELEDCAEEITALKRSNEMLLTEAKNLEAKVVEYRELANELTREYNGRYIEFSTKVGEFRADFDDLKNATALMGKDRIEAIESRDRVLAENCRMTEVNRSLKAYFLVSEEIEQLQIKMDTVLTQDDWNECRHQLVLLKEKRSAIKAKAEFDE